MKRQVFLGTMFSAALAVGLAAQTPSPTAGQAGASEQSKDVQITVTGCLQGPAGATGTTGTAGAGSAAPQFKLTSVTKSASSGSAASGTAGAATSGTSGGASAAASEYNLTGSASDLQKHVSKRVEIRGTMQSSPEAGRSPSATGGAAAGAGSSSTPTLRVTAVKEVSGSC
jgi:hypothetical protein